MIEQEILEIVREATDGGKHLNEIADQFRSGRNVDELITLLDSPDAELVSLGAWILSELHLELYNFARFTSRLQRLIDHANPAVRFHAFGALCPALNWRDAATQTLLVKLR